MEPKKNSLKSSFILIPLAILLAGAIIGGGIIFKNRESGKTSSSGKEENALPLTGYFAPAFSLKTVDGTEISLNDLSGQNILVVFWSTTCGYSAKELDDLKKFTDTYRGKIAVVAIMYKDPPQAVKQYQAKENINFTMLLDSDGAIAEKYKINGTPAHFFITKQGKITAVVPDYTPFEALLIYAREMFN